MNSVTIGDRENCGLSRMHLSISRQHHHCCKINEITVREKVSKTCFPLLEKLGAKSCCEEMSKRSVNSEAVDNDIQTRLFLGSSGIEASESGNALTRCCLSVSNSEYLIMSQLDMPSGSPGISHKPFPKSDAATLECLNSTIPHHICTYPG